MNPFNQLYGRLGAEMMPYGPPLAEGGQIEVAESFAAFEAEYAAVRQRVGIMHLPQRAILQLTGKDVADYLHRLCTQDINGLSPGASVRAFQLNDQGRIAADLIVHHGSPENQGSTWLELDLFDVLWVKELLEKRLFAEDVTIEDWTAKRTLLWMLGPAAVQLFGAMTTQEQKEGQSRAEDVGAMPGTHHVLDVPLNNEEATQVTAYRWDLGDVLGVRLAVASEHAEQVYGALLSKSGYEMGAELDAAFAERRRNSMRGRPVGWSAFNTVRIEEGVPLYHIDFGPTSLPAEVPGRHGIDSAVSFNKGCYLGQEVLARMKNLGHPKKILVGFKITQEVAHDVDSEENDTLPMAGAQVFDANDPTKVIGAVTSSTASPLAGQTPVGFAVVRWGRHRADTLLQIPAGGRQVSAKVVPLDAITDAP
ncbi:MAG: glycine cleavage T C-terminal barrel domain-containing protein [Algisphaera sp.]